MYFAPEERVVIFVDGPNLHATMQQLRFDLDYRRLLEFFRAKVQLIRAVYYTPLSEEHQATLQPLVDWLTYNGFTTITRPVREYTDSQNRVKMRSGIYVDMAVHAITLAEHYDHFVLFSGNGDFRSLIKLLQDRGRRVSVVSTLESSPPMIADDLRRQADQFIDLHELKPLARR